MMNRRSTLGTMSPAQLNSRGGQGNVAPRMGAKQPRIRPKQQQTPGAPNLQKSGRPSLSRRSSSMYGKGSQMTESRPISDRGFQQDCVRTLFNFLTLHGYSNPVTLKVLQNPSSKDVLCIVEFIFLQLDPNWEFRKFEEDVPLYFKRFGYPVQISRSAFYAAGSPVSWPSLLAALTWLVNLLTAMEPTDDGQGGSPFDDRNNRIFSEYVARCYHHFIRFEDEQCALLDNEYAEKVREENEKHVAEFEEIKKEADELKERLRVLKSDPSALEALEAKRIDSQEDIGKFKMVISNFETHKQAVEKKRDEKRQELARKKEEVVTIAKENEELKERVAAQKINAADAEKLLKEKEILEVNLQSVTNRKQELEKTAWDYEINSSKMLRDLENTAIQFNDSCARLGLISGEELHGGLQFEIKLQPRADTPAEILGGSIKTVIKPGLIKIKENSRKALAEEIDPEVLGLQDQLFKRDMAAREKQAQISSALIHNKKLEAQLKAREETEVLVSGTLEHEELEARIVQEELTLKNDEAESEHELREAEFDLETTVVMCNEEMENERKTGEEIMNFILTTKERTQATLQKVDDVAAQSIEVIRELLLSPRRGTVSTSWQSEERRG